MADVQVILWGPLFEDLQSDQEDKASVLIETEETFRFFYKMAEEVLVLKEVEERAWQAAEAAAHWSL